MKCSPRTYCQANILFTQDAIFKVIERLRGIIHNHVGIIDLSEELDIETVTEILPPSSCAMTSVAMTKSNRYGEDEAAARRNGARGRAIVAGQTREPPAQGGRRRCAMSVRLQISGNSAAQSILRRTNCADLRWRETVWEYRRSG